MVTKKFFLGILFAVFLFGAFALKAQYIPFSFWMSAPVTNEISGPICVDGDVYTSLYHDDKIFLGGNFTRMGQCTGSGALLNTTTGGLATLPSSMAKVDGSIYAITSDENEGWFIGGNFSNINGVPYTKNIAHIDSNGQLVTDWSPVPVDNTIRALAYDSASNTLFAGGDFSGAFNSVQTAGSAVYIDSGQSLGDETNRVEYGAINKVIPNPNGGFFIAGDFSSVGGYTRKGIAQVGPGGALVEELNIPFDDNTAYINDVCLYNDVLYFIGDFTSIGGVPRKGVAAWNLLTNSLSPFDPSIIGEFSSCATANNDKIYISGQFKNVNTQQVSALGAFDRLTGVFKGKDAPPIDGTISDILSDGSGGWYIAGSFSYKIQNEQDSRYATFLHLLSDFSIDESFQINTDNQITKLALGSNRLYLAGLFTQVNGEAHQILAAIDLSTKAVVSSFAPNVNMQSIYTMVEYGTDLFIGGSFTKVDGNSNYKYLARLNINTGTAQTWLGGKIVNANNVVRSIVVDSIRSRLYVGGEFTNFYALSNPYFVPLDLTTGNVITALKPSPNAFVRDVLFDSQSIYLAGDFTNIKGQTRNNLAAIDITTGDLTTWNPNPNGTLVRRISQTTDSIFAIGDFTTVGGNPRNSIAEIYKSNLGVTAWTQNLPSNVTLVVNDTNSVLVSAYSYEKFELGGFSRTGLASFDSVTGSASVWNPLLETSSVLHVRGLSFDNSNTLYFAGSFESVNGEPRNGLAALDINDSSALTPFAPQAPSSIDWLMDIVATDDAVYLSGLFDSIGGTARKKFAAFDPSTGALQALDISFDQPPEQLAVLNDRLYALGCFNKVNNALHPFIVQVDKTSGAPTAWNPGVNGCANTIAFYDNYAYVGGGFSSIGGKNSQALVAYDTLSGSLKDWNSPFDIGSMSGVSSLALNNSILYVGGKNLYINGDSAGVSALDANNASLLWKMPTSDSVKTLVYDSGILYVGGPFDQINGESRSYLAAIDTTTQQVQAWAPPLTNPPSSLQVYGSSVLVGGYALSDSRDLIQIDKASAAIETFPLAVNTQINTVAVKDNTAYVGGTFTKISGTERKYLAAFNINTKSLTTWNPSASSYVHALGTNSNTVYAGGEFDFVDGQQQRGVMALNAKNGKALIWNPDINTSEGETIVRALAVNGDNLYIGGEFEKVATQDSLNLASVKISTAEANSFNFTPNNKITSLFIKNNSLYVGGAFSEIQSEPRNALASIDLSTNTLTSFAPAFDTSNWTPYVHSLTGNETTLFVGGEFCVSGENYCFATSFDYAGVHQAIDYKVDDVVRSLALDGNTLYVGGDFYTINSFSSPRLASLNILTGLPNSWKPEISGSVYGLALTDNTIYVVGNFNSAGKKSRYTAAAIDRTTGLSNNWNPLQAPFYNTGNGVAYTVTPYALGSKVFIGGGIYRYDYPPEGVRQKLRSSFMIVDDLWGGILY